MKNEDRIVELLAESLQKQDRQSEILSNQIDLLAKLVESDEKQNLILEKVVESIDGLNNRVDGLNGRVDNLNGKMDHLRTDFNKMFSYMQTKHDNLEDRVKRIEDDSLRD